MELSGDSPCLGKWENYLITVPKRKRRGKMEFDFGLQFAHFGADFEEPELEGIKLDLAPGGVL